MGLPLADIYAAIQLMLAPVYANDFNYQGRVLKVLLQADAQFRSRPEDLNRYYIPSTARRAGRDGAPDQRRQGRLDHGPARHRPL